MMMMLMMMMVMMTTTTTTMMMMMVMMTMLMMMMMMMMMMMVMMTMMMFIYVYDVMMMHIDTLWYVSKPIYIYHHMTGGMNIHGPWSSQRFLRASSVPEMYIIHIAYFFVWGW